MDGKRVRAKRSGDEIRKVDRLSDLPDSLLWEVLLNLSTKDLIKTSILSSTWRNIWRYAPGLDLEYSDFPDVNAFVSFVDRFLGFNSVLCIQNFKLKFEWDEEDEPDLAHFTRWINTVVERKVQHLHILDTTWVDDEVVIPPTVYTCESLVSLQLSGVILANPKFVSLPSVKVIVLDGVMFANDLAFEMLISGCPVLENLTLAMDYSDDVKLLRVCSKSLLSFTYTNPLVDSKEDLVVAIDAPKLQYLKIYDYLAASFIINSPGSLVEVDITVTFNLAFRKRFSPNDLPMRNIIRNFLIGISNVKVMNISTRTLEVIYNYSTCERLPIFRNLSFLHVNFSDYRWEILPIFIESCPNLKSLDLEFNITPIVEAVSMFHKPHCFLPSLEYVEIVEPMLEEAKEIKLVTYFLEKSPNLKEFTFFLGHFRKNQKSLVRKKLLAIPRLSTSCQVFVL